MTQHIEKLKIGGGYGDTGTTLSADGTVQTDGGANIVGNVVVGTTSTAASRYVDVKSASGQRRGIRMFEGADLRWVVQTDTDDGFKVLRYTGASSFQDYPLIIDTSTGDITTTSDIVLTEKADHTGTPAAGAGRIWVKNTTPATLIFTDDAGTDITLGAGSGIASGDITGLSEVTGATGDYVIVTDGSDSDNLKKVNLSDLLGALSSGDITGKTTVTAASGDYVIVTDASDGDALKKVDASDFLGGGTTEFGDDVFRIQDDGDATKEIAFQASGITTGTTRTVTMPDTDVNLGDIATNSAKVSNATHTGDVTGDTVLTIASGAVEIGMIDATGTADGTTYLRGDGTWSTPGGGGTVTSVAVSGSDGIEVDSGSPITTSGTIALGVDAATMRTTLNVADGADVSPVDSVNGNTGPVVLDADDIDDAATTNKFATAAQLAKTDYLTVTGAVDLDTLDSAVTANTAKVTNATHTGDVTGSGALTIATSAVTNAKLADMSASTIKGRVGSTGAPQDLTLLQLMTMLDTPVAISSSSNATAWNSDNGRIFADTLTENTTVAASSGTPFDGQKVEFRFRQASGPYTLAWNAQFTAGETFSDTIPAVSTTAGDEDRYLFEYNATDSKYQLIAHATH